MGVIEFIGLRLIGGGLLHGVRRFGGIKLERGGGGFVLILRTTDEGLC